MAVFVAAATPTLSPETVRNGGEGLSVPRGYQGGWRIKTCR
jgi:hypothetical protein